jgi:GNAT superfamily N-acetyltransferase
MAASHSDQRPAGFRQFGLRVLRTEHLPRALELSQALQWPYRLEDWAFALELGHGIAAEIDGRLTGTALWWPYGERYASVGMIIVADEDQRKGIGGALMSALLADASGRTILLNSTVEGFALYARLGFEGYGHVNQHQALLASRPAVEPAEGLRLSEAGDWPTIYDLDHAATGMDRRGLIDALLPMGEVRVIESGGCISGYGCVRRWGRGVVIGPIVAADRADARALIAALAASHVGSFVRIDVPEDAGLSAWLETIGLPRVDQVVSMALGDIPQAAPGSRLFALSNQSLG